MTDAKPQYIISNLAPPEFLSWTGTNAGEAWCFWRQRFGIFSAATGLTQQSNHVQLNMFLGVIGPDALRVFNTFTFENSDDSKDYSKVISKFDAYFKPKKSSSFINGIRTQVRTLITI